MPNFTTGPASLPDIGQVSYNGVIFSPLFVTSISGKVVKDAANRTTKYLEYTLTVDGYVTLPDHLVGLADGTGTIVDVMSTLRRLLTAQAGVLSYTGRGFTLIVNRPGSTQFRDVAWGPIPELLDFQPLGAGRSAKIKWTVKTCVPEIAAQGRRPVLQFNEETVVSYDDAGFSTLSIKGTLEIPLTRVTQDNRTLTQTVDNFREVWMAQIIAQNPGDPGIDLRKFRITRRDFAVSRDKRTLEFDFAAEEIPYMGLPPGITVARGSYNVRPAKAGPGLCNWLCTLRCTYTVAIGESRRIAWLAFLALMRVRMAYSLVERGPDFAGGPPPAGPSIPLVLSGGFASIATFSPVMLYRSLFPGGGSVGPGAAIAARKAWLFDFTVDEGLYLDSKTITFSATWRLITTFANILVSSGLWRKVPSDGGNTWAASVRDISGGKSWLLNRLNPSAEIIVDFGGQPAL